MDLVENRKKSIAKFNSFREDFKKKEKEVRADLEKAARNWKEMNKILEKKKQKREE